MQKPMPEEVAESGRDDRPPILIGNATMFLQMTEGHWQADGGDGRTWTAIDDLNRPSRDLRMRVVQGNSSCAGFRQGANVKLEFGDAPPQNVVMTLAGRNPRIVSTVGLTLSSDGRRLTAGGSSNLRRVIVAGHGPCELTGGNVSIEICLKGDRC